MACEDCERRKIEENVDGLYQDVDELRSHQKNQGWLIVFAVVAGYLLLTRLNDAGVLTWRQMLNGITKEA